VKHYCPAAGFGKARVAGTIFRSKRLQPPRLSRPHVRRPGDGFSILVKDLLAHHDQLQRLVAIKLSHRHRISQPEDVETYLTETA
jgi:hypothetical protein